jgi:CheY-like chemotaxis protein
MTDFSPPSILIIDDTPQSIEVLAEILRKDNYHIRFALNWQKAEEMLQTLPLPHLTLLDIMMPETDGFEICRRLKGNPVTAAIPVIFVTAMGEIKDEEKGLQLGAVDYITKPLQPAIVTTRVKTHIDLFLAIKALEKQNELLLENAKLREEVELITRHDLKGPLSAFMNIPDLIMLDANLTHDQRELLQTMSQTARRMLEMINRSLDLVKIEMGTYELNPVEVDLVACLQKIMSELDSIRSFRRLEISVFLNGKKLEKGSRLFAMGEELMIESVFSNLIKNALEAAPEESEIIIRLFSEAPVRVEIMNPGAVPAAVRDRFFEKYQTSGKKRGTGLGAYSARMLTRAMRGELTAVIDAVSNFTTLIMSLLIAGQTSVETASGISGAMQLLKMQQFSYVICDCNLAAESGIDLLIHLRSRKEYDSMAIYMFSSEENPQQRQQALAAGADDFLDPPMTIQRLKKIFQKN